MAETWRILFNPDGDVADLLAYPAALAEGRIAGKYLLSGATPPDTLIVQGVRRKGILAGVEVRIDREMAARHGIDVAVSPRTGRRGLQPVGTLQLSELTSAASRKFKAAEPGPDDPAVLLYTSGTTGRPKGVVLTHRNFYSQNSEVVSRILPLESSDRLAGVLPLYHVYGLSNGLVSAVYFGACISLLPQYTPAGLLENIRETRATILIAIPSMYMHLLALARSRKAAIPRTLRLCVSGGAPLPLEVLSKFERFFETRIAEGYGLTETTSSVSLNLSGEGFKPGSIGAAAPGVEMKVVDERGREVAPGETGEIVIRGNVVCKGYWENPEATAQAIRGGWLYTGDLGYRDSDGCFFITDRKKDLIIRGGMNISPREIEEVLFSHPKVAEAAVIGTTDKRGNEEVKAFVVPAEGESPSAAEILEYCAAHLATYKVPRSVELRAGLPKSATGKVLRKELREGFEDERLIGPQCGGGRQGNAPPAARPAGPPSAGAPPVGATLCGGDSPSGAAAKDGAPETRSLGRLLEDAAGKYKKKEALLFEGQAISYRELNEQANKVANALAGLGIGPGDRVAIMLPNTPEFVYSFFGIQKLGAVAVPFNTLYKGREIAHILGDCGARAIITLTSFAPLIHEIRSDVPTLEHVIVTGQRTLVFAQPGSTAAVQMVLEKRRFSSADEAYHALGELLVDVLRRLGAGEAWYRHQGSIRAGGRKIATIMLGGVENLLVVNAMLFLDRLDTDELFKVIWVPPEIRDKAVEPLTSLREESGREVTLEELRQVLEECLRERLGVELTEGALGRDELLAYEKNRALAYRK